jgi:hypothetical protein
MQTSSDNPYASPKSTVPAPKNSSFEVLRLFRWITISGILLLPILNYAIYNVSYIAIYALFAVSASSLLCAVWSVTYLAYHRQWNLLLWPCLGLLICIVLSLIFLPRALLNRKALYERYERDRLIMQSFNQPPNPSFNSDPTGTANFHVSRL